MRGDGGAASGWERDGAGAAVLVAGFGTTVAMWSVGYVARLPALLVPSPALLVALLACLFFGGALLGAGARLDWRHGAAAGALSGLLNLLILGSFLRTASGEGWRSGIFGWVAGSVLLAAAIMAAGAWSGSRRRAGEPGFREWTTAFSGVAALAALLMLGIGGLVTSTDSGLAVVDWPNSFGHNMFLYPFSRMTGGIYYEHAHRLFGALVGLTTVALAGLLQLREPRAWVRRLGWAAVLLVVVQGVLGGLRVTGHLTLSAEPAAMRPSLTLAIAHGVLGQVFFALLVALGVFTSRSWREGRSWRGGGAAASALLVAATVAQLALGALQRHRSGLLIPHLVFGVAVVAPLAVHVGFRTWATRTAHRFLGRVGIGLAAAIAVQLGLGLLAYAALGSAAPGDGPSVLEVSLTTVHQWFGAVVLALGVVVLAWARREAAPPGA